MNLTKKLTFSLLILNVLLCSNAALSIYAQTPVKKSTGKVQLNDLDVKVSTLLKKMTLEEKVGQMAQVTVRTEVMHDAIVNYKVGSILNVVPGKLFSAAEWNNYLVNLQNEAKQTRLQIPILYGLDDIHGVNYVNGATLFPQQVGQAATFNPALVKDVAVITAYEARAAGIPWTFSPVLDLGVNPVWPRIWEGYGEDPYLTSTLGESAVHGYQDPFGSKEKLLTSLKHYMAYSDPKSGKDRTDAWIPEHYLREYHLPPFAAAVKAGAKNVMVNSALINGIPTHMNKHMLTDILKNELGFKGFIVTDWQDIEYVWKRDHIAKNYKEAVMLCINAGIDMAMIPDDYKGFCGALTALVKEGKVPMSRIDDAVSRILKVKFELDLFNTPVTFLKDYPKFGSEAFHQKSYEVASESITLLKNNSAILPLKPGSKILVCGPNANAMRNLNGGWSYSWQGDDVDDYAKGYHTLLEAIQDRFGKENITYVPGVVYPEKAHFTEDKIVDLDAAVKAAEQSDVIVLCIGENSYTETPGNLNDLNLPDNQQILVTALAKTGKPVVLILNEGRPRIISKIEPLAAAIVHLYLPGNFGADALADILTGKINPSGKLPYTYPRYSNDLINYIHKTSAEEAFNPQFKFGYGLSYTTFAYSDLKLNKAAFHGNETVTVTVQVKNTGQVAGKEVVELFSRQFYASITPDVKRLRRFEKISLEPGEAKTVTFTIPLKELGFINLQNQKVLESGEYEFQVAGLTAGFTI